MLQHDALCIQHGDHDEGEGKHTLFLPTATQYGSVHWRFSDGRPTRSRYWNMQFRRFSTRRIKCLGEQSLVSHQCGPCWDPSIDAICGLSLLLVLSFLPRGFSPGTPVFPSSQKPTFPNSNTTSSKETKNHSVDVLPLQILIYYLFHLANVDVGIVCQ